VSSPDIVATAIAKWDPQLTERLVAAVRPMAKRWYRSEVRGLESFPPGAALVVSNHSGGAIAVDVPLFAVDFFARFGYDRPLFTLTHDLLFHGRLADLLMRGGFIPASRANAAKALRSGGVVIVFPGGDYDAYRPTVAANTVDFGGRTGYVNTALETGAPIVPAVSIGAQETQLYLTRGRWLARKLRLNKLARIDILPISFGLPFGFSMVIPVNFPLPSKVVFQVLEPIDVVGEFGEEADPVEVDAHVRSVMQKALNQLAANRRFPVLG
jgi:1-acyl-sn-glycerol-3-phosphate acyltransferase